MLPVKATPIADGQIQKAARWWLANRDKAPNAFKEELDRGFALISQRPDVGAMATNVKLKGVRRIHLSRIRYFLYYRAMSDHVEVLALWHSSRLKGPVLKEPPNTPLEPTA
ncbi:MAG: type II toxin-antitoxin system RelE/ParE family toxin [Acidobacteria bacterium]|nr:type II toxin-antitoxin system RelE/ParE family toxin [Acidobacteriota bacterium]